MRKMQKYSTSKPAPFYCARISCRMRIQQNMLHIAVRKNQAEDVPEDGV